ncbi:MAG: flagellar hook-basal body complex protein [Lachnospiraceae bacterium]|nr:flagellar hook-basal body complex protein [Lachnospiraceae bacterium]
MNKSFYVGAIGAAQTTKRFSVIANNLANTNNNGFKPKKVAFSELIEYNVKEPEEAVTDLQAGAGTKLARTYTSFEVGAFQQTNSELDYAIARRNTFFAVQDPESGDVSYTRDGHFHRGEMADGFYLMTDSEKYVLDSNGQPIRTDALEGVGTEDNIQRIGLVTFQYPSRLMSVEANEYVPSDAGAGAIRLGEAERATSLLSGTLEASDTDMAEEFSHVIEAQRAFSYALRMVTTSDEIMGTINSLRG